MGPSCERPWPSKAERAVKSMQAERRQLDFEILVKRKFSDENIERVFLNFYLELCQFVDDGFGKEIEATSRGYRSPWSASYTTEFYHLVSQLARSGMDQDQWDVLLREKSERCALLQGVILKALEANVFSALLFGATPDLAKVLAIEDVSLIKSEGFRRSKLRADTSRMYLELSGGMPRHFWKEVDKVTSQMMLLLLPVYTRLGDFQLSNPENSRPGQVRTFQALHDLVAHAGWLSIAFRLCPQVAVWEWIRPGEPYKFEYVSVVEKTRREERRPGASRMRCQRVMVCVAPRISLHCSGTEGLSEGRIKYTVIKPRVVCYSGHRSDWEDDRAMVPFHQRVRSARWTLGWRLGGVTGVLKPLPWILVKTYLVFAMFVIAKAVLEWRGRQGSGLSRDEHGMESMDTAWS